MRIRYIIAAAALALVAMMTVIVAPTGSHLRLQPAPEREGYSESREALDFWTRARSYPFPDISPDKYYRAFMQLKMMKSALPASMPASTSWNFLGPVNFSGRMISVALNPLNPATVYAGSASGGLWRSHTGGSGGDWKRITTGFPVLGVNAIAIDPADTNTIYIGTGEVYYHQGSVGGLVVRTTRGSYGMGILKTTDGGVTWTKSLDWSYAMQRGVQTIRINPLNHSTLLAATSEGVYRSTDAGGSWAPVLSAIMAEDIAIKSDDTTLVLATCGNFASPGAGVYRSTDGGTNFVPVAGIASFSGKAMLDVYTARPNVVYASLADSTIGNGGLWRSTDFGLTWALLNSDAIYGVQGWYSHFVAVNPVDSSLIVRGSVNIYRSMDGGVTNSPASGTWADHHSFAHHPTNPNILYVVDDGGVWRSTNFGSTYVPANQGLQTTQFYNGFSTSASDSLRAIGEVQDHFGFMYTGSTNWPEIALDEVGWTAIDQTQDSVMYGDQRDGGDLDKSIDRGQSFFALGAPFTGDACWNTPFVVSPSNPAVIYFGRSRIFKSTNAGTTWSATDHGTELDGNPPLSMAIGSGGTDTVYVGTAPKTARMHVFRTAIGGSSWSDVTGTLPDRYPMDIAVDPLDSRIVFLALGGFGTGHFFKSTDAGGSWTDITGTLPDVPGTAVAVDPLNDAFVYAGNDLGVYASTNGGVAWTTFNEGLPEAVLVSDLVISPSNRSLKMATHGNGVFERKLLFTPVTGIGKQTLRLPTAFGLDQNFPNPFNPGTAIRFQITDYSLVRLRVYDVLGREVATLVNGAKQPGTYTVRWDASGFSSGVYYYRLSSGDVTLTRKMLLMK